MCTFSFLCFVIVTVYLSFSLLSNYNIAYLFFPLYYTHFEITGGPRNLIGSNWCNLCTIRTIFCFKSHIFPSQRAGHTKIKTTNRFQGLFKVTIKLQENERQRVSWQILQLLFLNSYFSFQNMDEFNFKPAQYSINNIFKLTKSCIWSISKWM